MQWPRSSTWVRTIFVDGGPLGQAQKQEESVGFNGHEKILEGEFENEQSCGEYQGYSSGEKVLQTPLMDSNSIWQTEANEVVLLVDEDLVEAQITWDIGKALGLQAKNEKAMVAALAKVHEC